ncbi:hypothetical protein OF83DRAFT_214271 [Amylostereum chailletii]|nr:hypothetical protein OF83DRAFT_214271 [Amylostereum chailletii]
MCCKDEMKVWPGRSELPMHDLHTVRHVHGPCQVPFRNGWTTVYRGASIPPRMMSSRQKYPNFCHVQMSGDARIPRYEGLTSSSASASGRVPCAAATAYHRDVRRSRDPEGLQCYTSLPES